MEKIVIQSGKKVYQIVDERDRELGVIEIDPADVGIIKRAEDAEKRIMSQIDSVKDIDTKAKDFTDKVNKADEEIKAALNDMFNYDISSVVFGKTHSLSTHKGVTFVERFLEAVTPVIEKVFEDESTAIANRAAKYTKQYHNNNRRKKRYHK